MVMIMIIVVVAVVEPAVVSAITADAAAINVVIVFDDFNCHRHYHHRCHHHRC